ncbi:hypothetical protein G9A89_019187 [Geosiphon pyriformis]|nr:hypothetical protein G9A89_019187 [Geosiphon pyriformis]
MTVITCKLNPLSILIYLFLFIFISYPISCFAAIREYNFTITYEPIPNCGNPDRPVIHVNGQHPAPPIEANVGDIVRINMLNKMPQDSMTLHFHGLKQRGTQKSDGPPFITQLPTLPGESYTYEFFACPDEAGTHFYHSHVGMSTITGHGALIIRHKNIPPQFFYHEERIIMLSDFWDQNKTDDVLEEGLYDEPFKWVGTPADLLINGKTNETNSCGQDVIKVKQNKIYRLRIIGATTLESLVFRITGHTMTIIEADGTYVNPQVVDSLIIAPGQRYSVLVTTNQPPNDYSITANVFYRNDNPNRSGLAFLSYENAIKKVTNQDPITNPWNPVLTTLKNAKPLPPLPLYSDRKIILRGQQVLLLKGGRQWNINAVSFTEPKTPILLDIYEGKRPIYTNYSLVADNGYNSSTSTYPLRYNEKIDLVFQNTFGPEGHCEYHPWHTHGHSFWEISDGWGEFPGGNFDFSITMLRNRLPLLRDTTVIAPRPLKGTPGHGCGWKLVRFLADNPGIWIAHCHVIPHMLMGMMVVFEEATDYLNVRTAASISPSNLGQFCSYY